MATIPSSRQQNVVRKGRTVTAQAPATLWVWGVVMLCGPDPTETTGEIQGEGTGQGVQCETPTPLLHGRFKQPSFTQAFTETVGEMGPPGSSCPKS